MSSTEGFFLHASSVDIDGRVVMFMGHSSAGKSTISRLLSPRYPIVADDKVWVSLREPGEWIAADAIDWLLAERTRVSPRRHQFVNQLPVLAVARIFKSETNQIQPLNPKETCRFLLDGVFEVDTQRLNTDIACRKRWFSLVARFSREVQGWRLTFRKDNSILTLITEVFGISN